MSKVRVVSLVASSLLAGSLMAETQVISVKSGWNLAGTNLDNSKIETNVDISDVWKYKDGKWSSNQNGDLTLSAGDGLWVKGSKETTLNLSGSASSATLNFSKSGWYLASPISAELDVTSLDPTKYSEFFTFKDNAWLDKTKVTSVKIGEGFWIKTGSDNLSLDDLITNAVVSGSVDLAGIVESSNGRSLRDEVVTDPFGNPIPPDEATVQIYDTSDTNYEEPLLTEGVITDPFGNYIITEDNFKDKEKAKDANSFVIRVIAKKGDKNYELSAVKTEGKKVEINPITTSVRTQIIDTIRTMFGDDFAKGMSEAIISAINTLAQVVTEKVEQDVRDNKLSLRSTDFETTKKPDEFKNQGKEDTEYLKEQSEKEEKLKTQLKDSSASTDVAKFENEVSYEKKTQFLKDTNTSDIDISKSATNVDIAIMEYDIISAFAKMNLAVHDGNGRLILFLPVPPEEFDKLPGEKFKKKVKKDDGSEFVVGDDPAIRAIDLEKSLKNASGSEDWAYELIDRLLNSPIVPYNAIKTLIKKDLHTTKLTDLGNFLSTQKDPYGNSLFGGINPIAPLIDNAVTLSSKADESVKKIIKEYIKPLLASNLLWLQDDLLFRAIEEKQGDMFLQLFGIQNGDTEEDFISRMENSTEFTYLLKDVGVPLINGIPPFAAEESTIQFKDGYKITEASTILPRTGISLTNMLMATAGLEEIVITKKKVGDIVGDYLPEDAKNLADREIWWAESVEQEQTNETSSQDKVGWLKDFILALASQVSGEAITAETRFAKVISDVKKHVTEFKKKVQEREKEFFKEKLVKDVKVDSVITFQIVDFEEAPITEVKEVAFIPHIENRKTLEIIPLESAAKVLTPVDTQARFKKLVTLYSPEAFVNEKGEIVENGEWRYITDYNVKITLNDGEVFYLDHPVALFPIEQNNLNYVYIDKNFDMSSGDGMEPMDEFHYQVLGNGDNLFYPLLNRELATYNNLTFKGMNGVKFGILAENWQQQIDLDIWNLPTIPKPKEEELINEFTITFGEGISEGALIMVDVSQNSNFRQAYGNAKLLMTIDFADKEANEVGIAIEPMPQDNFNSDFVKDGKPICYTAEGTEIELPLKEDGTYPFPDDPQYPAECLSDIFGEIPTCWAEELQKEVNLPMREDGTYPWPGDADFPKECMVGIQEIIPTDCEGKPFPFVDGKYITPENDKFMDYMNQYNISCMGDNPDYFNEFKDKFEERPLIDNVEGMIGDKPKECYDNMGNVVPCENMDMSKECKDEAGNVVACMSIEEGNGVIDENQNTPMCISQDGDKIVVPWNEQTNSYSVPGDGVWESACKSSENIINTSSGII